MAKKAIIYCRTATRSTDSIINALEVQVKICTAYAKKHDYSIVKVISEVGSGMDEERHGIQKVLRLCDNKQADAVICADPDRISRDFSFYIGLVHKLEGLRVKLFFVNSQKINHTGATFIEFMSKMYSEEHSKRIREGVASINKRKRGK